MRAILWVALVLLLMTPPGVPGAEQPFWLKPWTITKIDNSDDPVIREMIGRKIIFSLDQLIDPLSRDCTQGLDYSDIQQRPVMELGTHFGSFWKWPAFSQSTITSGWVRCQGSNVGAFAFADDAHAYLFYEEGAVLELK